MTGQQTGSRRPLVVVGIPRSGTTWTMQVLQSDRSLYPLLEPDNEGTSAPAIWGKRHAGRFPALGPGDVDDAYRELWGWILGGARRSRRLGVAAQIMRGVQPPTRTRFLQGRAVPVMRVAGAIASHPGDRRNEDVLGRRILVKTVHAPLAVEWLAREFDLDVLVLLRHPGNVLASWLALELNERYVRLEENELVRSRFLDRWGVPRPGRDPLERMVWQIGLLTTGLEEAARRHPEWVVRTHEHLCGDPTGSFRTLFDVLGLSWSEATDAYLAGSDRPGEGFHTQRVAAELPEGWRTRLDADQIASMARVLSGFPLETWPGGDFTRSADD